MVGRKKPQEKMYCLHTEMYKSLRILGHLSTADWTPSTRNSLHRRHFCIVPTRASLLTGGGEPGVLPANRFWGLVLSHE